MNAEPRNKKSWETFLKEGLWQIDLNAQPSFKALIIKTGRTALMALSKFVRDECPQKASALTFYGLLSSVPVAAMAFGIAKGFGFQATLEKDLLERFAAQAEVVNHVIGFAKTMLESTKGGLIAGIGVVVLFWSVVKVLRTARPSSLRENSAIPLPCSLERLEGVRQARARTANSNPGRAPSRVCPRKAWRTGSKPSGTN